MVINDEECEDLERKAESLDLDKAIMDKKIAALPKIQRFWLRFRFKSTKRFVLSFLSTGLAIDFVKSISFESLVAFLRTMPVIDITKKCLHRIYLLSTLTCESSIDYSYVNVRIFLSSYMIAYYPTYVFESMEPLEQKLFDVAVPLTVKFENICNIIKSSEYHSFLELSKDFIIVLHEYLKRFKAWKVHDEARLICRIKYALTALYQAQLQLLPEDPTNSEVNYQISQLRGQIMQLAGINSLNEFDEQRNMI